MLQILCKTVAIFLGKLKISTLSFFFTIISFFTLSEINYLRIEKNI